MKIMLHGSDNDTNFGDFLFADMFWKRLKKCNKDGENIFLEFPRYGFGEYFRRYMGYTYKQSLKDLFTSDMLVYFSGGYFGERTDTLKESVMRFIKYMPIGILFALRRKPILILGVGGGPISNKPLRIVMRWILDYSLETTVRDEETADYYKGYGVKKDIKVTSDTAQAITVDMLPSLDNEVEKDLSEIFRNKKIIFLHIYGSDSENQSITDKIIDPLNSFLADHKEYGVIIGHDQKYSMPIEQLEVSLKLKCDSIYHYKYAHPWELCSLLNKIDLVITPKLHVGIISATLSKSVLSFPDHPEKIKRYYKQIGESKRCVPMGEVTSCTVEKLLYEYHENKIILSYMIVKAANNNLNILEEIVLAHKSQQKVGVRF